jgi:hypothetical protein
MTRETFSTTQKKKWTENIWASKRFFKKKNGEKKNELDNEKKRPTISAGGLCDVFFGIWNVSEVVNCVYTHTHTHTLSIFLVCVFAYNNKSPLFVSISLIYSYIGYNQLPFFFFPSNLFVGFFFFIK